MLVQLPSQRTPEQIIKLLKEGYVLADPARKHGIELGDGIVGDKIDGKVCVFFRQSLNENPEQNLNGNPNQNLNKNRNQNLNENPNQNLNENPIQKLNENPNQNLNENPNQNLKEKRNRNDTAAINADSDSGDSDSSSANFSPRIAPHDQRGFSVPTCYCNALGELLTMRDPSKYQCDPRYLGEECFVCVNALDKKNPNKCSKKNLIPLICSLQ